MSMTGEPGASVSFTCTKPGCQQIWAVNDAPGGPGPACYCLIMKTIWPQGMKEDSAMFRDQYMPAWLEERQHRAAMFEVGGFWTHEQAEAWMCEVVANYEKWFRDHRRWWQFWKKGRA